MCQSKFPMKNKYRKAFLKFDKFKISWPALYLCVHGFELKCFKIINIFNVLYGFDLLMLLAFYIHLRKLLIL